MLLQEIKIDSMQELLKNYVGNKTCGHSELLRFDNVDGRDVYNCSVPFDFEGETYIWGRVEKRSEWATSVTLLFKERADGVFERNYLVDALPVEDPFFVKINGTYVLVGTHVVKHQGKIKTYYGYFYSGDSPFSLKYFTTGPDYMKDIRLVQLPKGRVGIFSRPRNSEIMKKYGHESQIGFTVIDSLEELTANTIEDAAYIDGIFSQNEWGGVNQAFYLDSGRIGIIGHQCYNEYENGLEYPTYINTAYVYDFERNKILHKQIIGTRHDYPHADSKLKTLAYCAFTSGIRVENGEFVLYSGLGDTAQGKLMIGDPFAGFGKIVFP